MKKYLVAFALLFILAAATGQQKKKSTGKEKPPTQKEMEEMMKEMEKAMEGISPEDKKMMDSMGVKMPDMKNLKKTVGGITDAQLKQAFEDEGRLVPQKDLTRINKALATKVDNTGMSAFINSTHQYVLTQLSANTKSAGAEILQETKQKGFSVANTAVAMWMDGKPTLALYLMGEACKLEPGSANNLNNYAAFLTMGGAEEMALPILNNLAKRYPQNSTLYNNIAQAWIGLGDITRAEKNADSAIRIYPGHSQANFLKGVIEESKGNTQAAVAAFKKSVRELYSPEKEDRLNKLGYKLKSEDIDWEPPLPRDPVGMDKFTWPDYPRDVHENAKQEAKWKDFKASCQQLIDELNIKLREAEAKAAEIGMARSQQILQASFKGGQSIQIVPALTAKAIIKLGPTVNDVNGNMSFVFAKELDAVIKAREKGYEDEKLLSEKQERLNKKYENMVGEGKKNDLAEICAQENLIRTEFLQNANIRLQAAHRQYLHYVSRRTSDLLNYYQYTLWPEQFEVAQLTARVSWLTQIKDQYPWFKDKSSWCPEPTKPGVGKIDSLPQFDDIACKYVSEMNLIVYKITSTCSKLEGEFDFKGVKIKLKDNCETGRFNGSVQVGVSEGVGNATMAVKGSIAGLVEFDKTGITDVGVVAGVGAKWGPKTGLGQLGIAGAEVKATVNTGFNLSGKFLGKK